MSRKQFNEEYKISAVKLVLEDNHTVTSASKSLNLSSSTLYRWIQEYEDFGENAFPGKGTAIYNKLYKQKNVRT